MCVPCDRERERARVWATEVHRRTAALEFAKTQMADARARVADHAAQHPYREGQ
jgi:hypothetical protein